MKEDDKVMVPLFPRLHVNDTDKGGPRAPPRNKMALYEQLSVPSPRLKSASSTRPFPHHNSSSSVPSLSSNQGCGHQRNMFSPFRVTPQVSVHSTEMVNSRTSDGMNHSASRMELERKSMKQVSSGNLVGIGLAAECSSHRPHRPNSKSSRGKILDDVDDIVVPSFNQSGPLAYSQKDSHMTCTGKLNSFCSQQMQKSLVAASGPNSNEKSLEQRDIDGIKLRNSDGSLVGKDQYQRETSSMGQPEGIKEKSAFHILAEKADCSKGSLVRTDTNNLYLTDKSSNGNTLLCQANGDLSGAQTLNDITISDDGKSLNAKNELHSKSASRKRHRTMSPPENYSDDDNTLGDRSLLLGDIKSKDDAEPSKADTVLGFRILPDDIVGRIGPKHFWKARRAIVNQQRVFAMQLFELHRLIKVQKMIAASPHLLLEGNTYLNESQLKAYNKDMLPQLNINSQPEESRRLDDVERAKHNVEPEQIAGIPALPACGDSSQGGPQGQVPKPGSSLPSRMPMALDDKSNPLCFPPMANQWLLPVMSPSEGLVYKPYSGPCPPTGGFMTPFYGSCTPLMNPAYGLPASHQPPNMAVLSGQPAVAPHYFATPYDLRTLNPVISSSAVEQVSNLPGSQANGQTGQHSRSSCNVFHSPRKEALSGHLRRFPESKNSEFQGSTASSPSEKAHTIVDRTTPTALPSAPAANSFDCPSQCSGRDSQTRVIKVVPHNPRSATESAARIFQSIQEERQQHDSSRSELQLILG